MKDSKSLNIDEECIVSVEASTKSQQDRRRFFRIEDEITLSYREVCLEDVPDAEGFREEILDTFSLSSALESLTQESRTQLKRIERSQPEVAGFLKTLEQKIELLTQSLLIKDAKLADCTIQKVNISAAGLAFDAEQALRPGAVIEIKMILYPSLVALVTYGKVIYCNTSIDDNQFPYHIGVDFLSLREQDREVLIRHLVKKQIKQLRERKESD